MVGDEKAAGLLIEFAKTAAKCNKVFDRQLVATEEDDEMIGPRGAYHVEVLVGQCVGRNSR